MDPEILDEMFQRTHPLFWPVLIVHLVWFRAWGRKAADQGAGMAVISVDRFGLIRIEWVYPETSDWDSVGMLDRVLGGDHRMAGCRFALRQAQGEAVSGLILNSPNGLLLSLSKDRDLIPHRHSSRVRGVESRPGTLLWLVVSGSHGPDGPPMTASQAPRVAIHPP